MSSPLKGIFFKGRARRKAAAGNLRGAIHLRKAAARVRVPPRENPVVGATGLASRGRAHRDSFAAKAVS